MTRYVRPSTNVLEAPVKSGQHGRAVASAKKSTTSKAGWEPDSLIWTRWWVSAVTVTNSSDVTQRWRMTVDGC